MKFKGTWIFSALVLIIVGFAIYDYQKTEKAEGEKYKEHHAYRDASVEQIQGFKVTNINGEFEIARQENQWRVIAPLTDLGDRQEIEAFLTGVFTQNITQVDTEGALNWEEYGLEQPFARIELKFADKTSTLEFGSVRAYDDSYYVRKDGQEILYTGDSSWTSYVNKAVNDLRNKDLFEIDGGEVTSFLVQHKGQPSYKLVQVEGKWQLDKKPDFRLDDSAIENYLSKLRHLSADKIAADAKDAKTLRQYGLSPAPTVITVTREGEEAVTWTLSMSAEKDGKFYLISSSTPAVYEATSLKVGGLHPELSHFRNKVFPFQFDQTRAHVIQIVKKDAKNEERFAKINNQWEYDVENPHVSADPEKIDQFLNALRALQVKKYLGKGPMSSKDIKSNRVRLLDPMQNEMFVIEWGGTHKEQEQEFYVARTNLADEAFAIEKSALDEIAKISLLKDPPAEKNGGDKQTKAE